MHFTTLSNLGRASAMFMTVSALFTSMCVGMPDAGSGAVADGATCAPNRNYTVVPNDDCTKISKNQSVSTQDVIALNCLSPDGSNLQANTTIQLPGCCTTYSVQPGDNCTSVATSHNLTLQNFYAFNPVINHNCSNLIAEYNVCLTAPQGTPFNPAPCSNSHLAAKWRTF